MAILTVETLKKRHGWWRMKDITLPYFFFKPKVSPEKRISCDNGEWFIDGIAVDEVRNQVTTYAEPHFFLLEFVYWIASGFNGIRDRFALLVLHDLMQIEHSLSPIEGYPESQHKEETLRKSRGHLNEHKQHPFMDNDRCLEISEALDHWSNMDEGPTQIDIFREEKIGSEEKSKAESRYLEPSEEKQSVATSASEVRPSWEDYLTQIEKLIEEMISLLQSKEGGEITYSALAKKIHYVRLKALRQYHPDPPGNTNNDEQFKGIEPILTALKEICEGLANTSAVEKIDICRELTKWKENLTDLRNIENTLEIQERKRRYEEALDNLLQKLAKEVNEIEVGLIADKKKLAAMEKQNKKQRKALKEDRKALKKCSKALKENRRALKKCSEALKIDEKAQMTNRKLIKLLVDRVDLLHPAGDAGSEHVEDGGPELSRVPESKDYHIPILGFKQAPRAGNRYYWHQLSTSSSVSTADEALLTEDDEDTSEEESTAEVSCNV